MSTAAHTPGPWEIVKAERLSHDAPEIGPNVSDGGILGGSPDDPVWVIEGEIEFAPDAHLIAAAPEMLAVLNAARIMLKNRDQRPEEMKLLDAIKHVVAKAEGWS